jgi:hypothetical protein
MSLATNSHKPKEGTMKDNTAITIVRAHEGFVIFQNDDPSLPSDPEGIVAFSRLEDSSWGNKSVFEFLRRHFADKVKELSE